MEEAGRKEGKRKMSKKEIIEIKKGKGVELKQGEWEEKGEGDMLCTGTNCLR